MRPIVVYDTNILISGMIWGGTPYDCIALAQRNRVEAGTCAEILDEFSEKLTTKFKASPLQTAEIVTELLTFHQSIKIVNQLKGVTADPDDDKVIECAVVGGATHIVTGGDRPPTDEVCATQ
ncbi:putative toxin-antitoxin system toxin component, PIN family [Candidatus Poribacteria bacterium]|nr:putative toxin-antitoxin system toxin component, PIN family [Candidatus Poribacteria bacterium]MYA55892.1 putative toxin-antitoxin system toxin component, PIN family [Candidatus Poribacteria bacterium]